MSSGQQVLPSSTWNTRLHESAAFLIVGGFVCWGELLLFPISFLCTAVTAATDPLCRPGSGVDEHLPPLIHMESPSARFHLKAKSFTGWKTMKVPGGVTPAAMIPHCKHCQPRWLVWHLAGVHATVGECLLKFSSNNEAGSTWLHCAPEVENFKKRKEGL